MKINNGRNIFHFELKKTVKTDQRLPTPKEEKEQYNAASDRRHLEVFLVYSNGHRVLRDYSIYFWSIKSDCIASLLVNKRRTTAVLTPKFNIFTVIFQLVFVNAKQRY